MPQLLRKYWYIALLALMTLGGATYWRAQCGGEQDDIWFSQVSDDPYSDTGGDPTAHPIQTWTEMAQLARLTWLVDNGRLANYWAIFALNKCPEWLRTAGGALTIMALPLLMLWLVHLLIGIDLARRRSIALLAFLMMWFIPFWEYMNQTDYFLNYIPATALMLATMCVAIRWPQLRGWPMAAAVALAFASGMWNEASSMPLVAFLFIYWLAAGRKQQHTAKWLFVAAAIGVVVQDSSLGQWERLLNNPDMSEPYAVWLKYHGLQAASWFWLPVVYLIAYAFSRRRQQCRAAFWAVNTAIVVGIALLFATRGTMRVAIPTLLMASAAILALAAQRIPYVTTVVSRTLIGVATCAYAFFLWQIGHWEGIITRERQEVYAQMWTDRQSHIAFVDIHRSGDIPWYVRRVVSFTYLNVGHVWIACPPTARTHYYSVLPKAMRGLPYHQLPPVPGNNPFRGTVDEMILNQKVDTMFVTLHLAGTVSSQNPIWTLIGHLRGTLDSITVFCEQREMGTYMGDTIYVYHPMPLGRSVAGRVIESVDLATMPHDWGFIPEPVPDTHILIGFKEMNPDTLRTNIMRP